MLPFMAIPGRLAVMFVACILVHGFVAHSNVSSSQQYASDHIEAAFTTDTLSNPAPISVAVYVEALCIDSKRYMNNQLAPAYNTLGAQVMNLTVVFYGNAHTDTDDSSDQTLVCQHGAAECDANTYAQCAADLYPVTDRNFPYFKCLFDVLPMGHRDEPFAAATFASCGRHAALDTASLLACHNDPDQVKKLEKQAAAQTPADHKYVPWVELEGVHLENEDGTDLLQEVCRLYTLAGGSHAACGEIVSVQVA